MQANQYFEDVLRRVPEFSTAWSYHSDLYIHQVLDDIETLRGRTKYFCDPPGDEVVDSIDEIVTNAYARLTKLELESLQMEGYLFDDSDGDGSICNSGELDDYPSRYVRQIELSVTPNIAPVP